MTRQRSAQLITVTRQEAALITMSRSIFEAIRTDKLEEVTIRLNLGEDIDQSFPPRLQPVQCLCGDDISV